MGRWWPIVGHCLTRSSYISRLISLPFRDISERLATFLTRVTVCETRV